MLEGISDLYMILGGVVVIGFSIAAITVFRNNLPVTEILMLRKRDMRGEVLKVDNETDLTCTCKRKDGVVSRFFKAGPSFVFTIGRRMVTRFFGMEGTAYTSVVREGVEVKMLIPVFLRELWGETFYNQIPSKQRDALETDPVGVTVDIVKAREEKPELPELTNELVDDEDEREVLGQLAKAEKKNAVQNLTDTALKAAFGAFIMYFLIKQGLL